MVRILALALTLGATAVAWGAGEARSAFGAAGADPAPAPVSPPSHLQYFGFYASAMGNWNFTAELAPFTNLTWIHLGSEADPAAAIPEFVTRLGEARDAGVQAVLSIEHLLFSNPRGDPRPDEEIEGLLVELRAQIEAAGLLGTVAMMYAKDEPVRNFVDARDPSFIDEFVTGEVYDDVYRDLEHVNGWIRLVFPDRPIGVILSGYRLHHRFFRIPASYDWVGFDCYRSLFGGCDDDRSFIGHYRQLLEHMQPHQRLMAVPETWARSENLDRADWPDVLLSRLRHHYEIALAEPRFVAFVPFIWSLDVDAETPGLGLNRIPELYDDGVWNRGTAFVEAVLDIGVAVKQGRPVYPNMAWAETEDVGRRPAPAFDAAITAVSPDGTVEAWAVDRSLSHKNLRVQFRVYDGRGRLVHKSGVRRTDLREIDGRTPAPLGLHGIRYGLPERVLERYGPGGVLLDMRVFADGRDGAVARIESRRFTPFRSKP